LRLSHIRVTADDWRTWRSFDWKISIPAVALDATYHSDEESRNESTLPPAWQA
jgi:hypothetical protein